MGEIAAALPDLLFSLLCRNLIFAGMELCQRDGEQLEFAAVETSQVGRDSGGLHRTRDDAGDVADNLPSQRPFFPELLECVRFCGHVVDHHLHRIRFEAYWWARRGLRSGRATAGASVCVTTYPSAHCV